MKKKTFLYSFFFLTKGDGFLIIPYFHQLGNLTKLCLQHAEPRTPISFLTNLIELSMIQEHESILTDHHLMPLTNLKKLRIDFPNSGQTITDFAISSFTNLVSLSILHDQRFTSNSIKNLTNLEHLEIHSELIDDIGLQNLMKLTSLALLYAPEIRGMRKKKVIKKEKKKKQNQMEARTEMQKDKRELKREKSQKKKKTKQKTKKRKERKERKRISEKQKRKRKEKKRS